jgi:hypothetical protein
VRKKAQVVLFTHFHHYPYSYRCLLPDILQHLKEPDPPEHQFKVLHVVKY